MPLVPTGNPRLRSVAFKARPLWPFAMNRESRQAVGLAGWWPFQPAKGGRLFDLSMNGNRGILTGMGGGDWRPGALGGQALSFDGVDDSVNLGNSALLNNRTSISVSFWMSSSDTTGARVMIGRYDNTNPGSSWLVISDDLSNAVRWYTNDGVAHADVFGARNVHDGVWHHVAVTWRTGANNKRIYVDGARDGIGEHSVTLGSNTTDVLIASDAASSLGFLAGLIDDVRIYDRALSAAEVRQIFDPKTRFELYEPLYETEYRWAAAPSLIGQLFSQSIAAVGAAASAVSRQVALARTLSGQAINAATFARVTGYLRTLAAASQESASLSRPATYPRTLAAASATVAALTRLANYLRTLTSSSAGAGAVARTAIYLRTLTTTNVNAASLTRLANYVRTLAAQSVAVTSIARLANYLRALAAQAAAAAALTRLADYAQTLAAQSIGAASLGRVASYLRSLAAQSTAAVSLARAADYPRTLAAVSAVAAAVTRIASHLRTLAAASASAASVGRLLALFRALSALGVNAASVTTTTLAEVVRSFLGHMLTRTTDLAARFSATDQVRGKRLAGTEGRDELSGTDRAPGRTVAGQDDPSKKKPGTGGGARR